MEHTPGFYERYIKRGMDIVLSGSALVALSPVLLVTAVLVRKKLGSPVVFCQQRPGKNEKIFKLYKFRTMTDERDEKGNLLPDSLRLTGFGKLLRSTSLDELPEVFNILKGDMSVIGPRPQLVRDMVFMTPEQRRRHCVRPGLSGLAQVRGRNSATWEGKLATDLEYIEKITFFGDIKIILMTVLKVVKREGVSAEGMDTAEDLGDYLLRCGDVTQEEYDTKQADARELLSV